MAKEPTMVNDASGRPIPIVGLKDSQDIDGTSASAQSAAIDGRLVRILSVDNALRVVLGEDPTATDTDILIQAKDSLWLPITPGYKVAIKGGKANICTAE